MTLASSSYNYQTYIDKGDQGISVTVDANDPVKSYYYYFVCTDRALNKTTTPVYNFGNNNIANTGSGFMGLESYWNMQSYSLGKAGDAQVNLNNGNLIVSATDFALPGLGTPLAMSRFYNSLATYDGITGKGWRNSYETFLQTDGLDIILNDPDGSNHRFTYKNATEFNKPAGEYRKVVKNPNNSYTVIDKGGNRFNFGIPSNNIARLQSVEDRFGNVLTLSYENGLLKNVREPSGNTANFTYWGTSNKVRRVDFTPVESGYPSRYVEYGYLDGMLTDIYYPYEDANYEIAVKYGYNSGGLLTSSKVYLCYPITGH